MSLLRELIELINRQPDSNTGMLLGHWYLVQPGLPRRLLNEIVTALGWIFRKQLGFMFPDPKLVTDAAIAMTGATRRPNPTPEALWNAVAIATTANSPATTGQVRPNRTIGSKLMTGAPAEPGERPR